MISSFKDVEPPFNDVERTFSDVECPFNVYERRLLLGIESFSFKGETFFL